MPAQVAHFPADLLSTKVRRVAVCDFLTRAFGAVVAASGSITGVGEPPYNCLSFSREAPQPAALCAWVRRWQGTPGLQLVVGLGESHSPCCRVAYSVGLAPCLRDHGYWSSAWQVAHQKADSIERSHKACWAYCLLLGLFEGS